jgi:thiamine-phosphate pyrophosphorylase
MSHEISPAVERAALAAAKRAAEAGVASIRLVDWIFELLDDDEGRPFELLARLGIDAAALRNNLVLLPAVPAPAEQELFTAARRHGVRLRGDPDLTTDLLLYAVMVAHDGLRNELESYGASPAVVERGLVGANMASEAADECIGAEFVAARPAGSTDAVRVLDANLNRARESLRVLDDYVRFVRNDRIHTDELKSLRHRLAAATDLLPSRLLLLARDTAGDVGTTVATAGEYVRSAPEQVAKINFKRLQESLRSLEEFGKLESAPFAREAEAIRYAAYSLEKAVLAKGHLRDRLAAAKVYVLLTGSQCVGTLDWTIAEAAAGGATVFQLREKDLPDRELLDRARRVREWTRRANALFIVNDRPDIAKLAEADGVHLGQDDLPIADTRRILGPDAIVGASTHELEQVRRAVLEGADYIGVGPVFSSTTKAFDRLAGPAFVREAFAATALPAFALGGIAPATIGEAVRAGATRVAVGACVATADEPRAVVQQLMEALDRFE